MLNKLLKYDLKYMIKNMIVFYILSIFFAILTRIFFSLKQTVIITIIGQISLGCMFSMAASVLFNTVIRSWVRFKDSIYKDESYLTHTLPVTKNEIYNSKFIQTLIFFIIGFIIAILSIFITYYTKERWLLITNLINKITTGLNFNTALFVIGIILVVFLEIFNAIQCGFLGIIMGHQRNNNKTIYAVVFGFLAYLISQSLVLLLVFICGIFDSDIMAMFKSNTLYNIKSLKLLMIIAIILYIIIIGLMNAICRKKLNKGVNIE